MKIIKNILSVVLAAMLMLCAFTVGNTVNATSSAYIYLTIYKLTSSTNVGGVSIPSSAYKVEVNVAGNTTGNDVASTAIRFNLTNLTPYCNSGKPVITQGGGENARAYYSSSSNAVSITSGGGSIKNGKLYTFYVSKSSGTGSVSTTVMLCAAQSGAAIIPTNTVTTGSMNSSHLYKVGDANGGGTVDSVDATAILTALSNHYMPNKSIPITGIQNDLSSWFPNAKCADAADANQDGNISSADSNAILDYYAVVLLGESYSGTVGKVKYYIA